MKVWDTMSENIRDLYRKEDGSMKVAGDWVTFPQLGDTLEAISMRGPDAFYSGEIAQSIIDTVSETGGIMTLEDLRRYAVKMEEPLRAQYNGTLLLLYIRTCHNNVYLCTYIRIVQHKWVSKAL